MASTQQRNIPYWLGIPIVALIVALAGYLLWWSVWRPGERDEDVIIVDSGARDRGQRQGGGDRGGGGLWGGIREGVTTRSGFLYVRNGDVYLRTSEKAPQGPRPVSLEYVARLRQSWLTPAQWDLHILIERLMGTPKLAEYVQLTDQQRQQLRSLAYGVSLSGDETQRLQTLLKDWEAAPANSKAATENKLIAAVGELGKTKLPATKDAMVKRVQQIPQILSKEQLEKARKGPPAPPAAPATAPAAG